MLAGPDSSVKAACMLLSHGSPRFPQFSSHRDNSASCLCRTLETSLLNAGNAADKLHSLAMVTYLPSSIPR